jgi:DNA mismatch repair protein MutL
VEYRHIIMSFNVCFSAPIYFIFFHNGSEMFNLPPAWGSELLVSFWQNQWEAGSGARRDRDRYDSWIYVSLNFKKKQRRTVFLVNDRFIKSGYLHHAIMAAYDGLYETRNLVIFYTWRCRPIRLISISIPLKQRLSLMMSMHYMRF